MGYILLSVLLITIILCYLEDYIKRYRFFLYILMGFVMVLIAGLREIGLDPDSENYEYSFQHYYQSSEMGMVEPSFTLISAILNVFTDNVHLLFLVYAFLGVTIKLYAFKKNLQCIFVPMMLYISFYFVLHEMTQIRAGVVSALFLLAVYHIAKKEKRKALLLIIVGSFFHYSSLALLPTLMFGNKDFNRKRSILIALLIPLSYLIYFGGISMLLNTDIPLIGNKLAIYQQAMEKGKMTVNINVFDPVHLVSVMLFYYTLYFRKTITAFNENYNVVIKIVALGLFLHTSLAFLPVLALRISQLYCIVNIFLFSGIVYTFKQKWMGITVLVLLSIFQMYLALPHYGLGDIVRF